MPTSVPSPRPPARPQVRPGQEHFPTHGRQRPTRWPHLLAFLALLTLEPLHMGSAQPLPAQTLSAQPLSAQPLPAQPLAPLGLRAPSKKPALYLLTISVADYQDERIPALRFPEDDARALRAWAQAQEGKLYGQVRVDSLTNPQASRSAIIEKLIHFYRDAQPQDQLILYLAGHGKVVNERGTWHFLP